ncbi:serine hydrolase domain-containing protein [Nonomuraea endophytica]|uniref:D-alanyl-D-alanine carboxypeptidase n=1 Tax=Nonomuraea endophytica TaxID=714136 RepID=A0A7W8EGH0_9ACTN|nr:serine hydrolase domain-containing protein [Nonomuraea endophytica]MBB5078609.1 D-alanyl-D-alanine carboxypeptidase [Nonomuraea endophytica]
MSPTDKRPRAYHRAAVTALMAALLAGSATPAVAATGKDRPELRKAIQTFVDAGFLGVQVRVNDERGQWVGTAGQRKLGTSAKPPANGHFWVGSVTKTFHATVALQLAAEGKIGLDAPVAGYLPKLGLDRRITVRMLLQHTSGLFNYTGDLDPDGSWVPGLPATGKEWLDNRFRSYRPEELVRFALSKPARFEPGATWGYSNTNYTLTRLLIEKVTGRSFETELKRRIVGPLGLKGTMVPGNRTQLPAPYAHGYFRYQDAGQWKVADVSRQNLSLLAGAGDMLSTTKDLHTFFSALNSGKLLPAKLLAEMREPHPKSDPLYGNYGLGVFVQNLGPACGTVINHNGSPPSGYAALMYSTPDGSKTLTASLTAGDAAFDFTKYPKLLNDLVKTAFCGSQTGSAQ